MFYRLFYHEFVELIISQSSLAKREWIEERLEYLSELKGHTICTDGDWENIEAVLQEYKSRSLKRPSPGMAVIYFGGIRRTDEIEPQKFEWRKALEWDSEVKEKQGGLFLEEVRYWSTHVFVCDYV